MRRGFAVSLLAALLCTSVAERESRAYDKQACVTASDQGQGLRLDGKLTAARDQLLACADPSCPSIVRTACFKWLVDLQKQIPSVIAVARDAAGNDVVGAEVRVDGSAAREAVSGRPMSLDPGAHTLHFFGPHGATAERQFVLAEGEQRRQIEAVLRNDAAAQTAANPATRLSPAPSLARTDAPSPSSPVPWGAWGFTIGAGVALATFATFAIDGHVDYENEASSCDGRCSPDKYSPINTKFVVADVSLGVAAVATGVAAVLFLTHHSPRPPTASASGALFSF